jgi:hypothetical protein
MSSATLTFSTAEPPTEEFDSIPVTMETDFPCEVCGKESGPYSGRGPKPKRCDDHKKKRSAGPSVRVTGKSAEMAAQAAEVLTSINAALAVGLGGFGFIRSMTAIFERNEDFKKTAYSALVTDPNLCRQILAVGEKSAKMTLGLAYVSLGMGIAPTLAEEYRDKKAARLVEMGEE